MKISKNSMIYRSFKFHQWENNWFSRDPNTLCAFMRGYFFRVIRNVMIALVFSSLFVLPMIGLALAVGASILGILPFVVADWFGLGILGWIVTFGLSIAYGIATLIVKLQNYYLSRKKIDSEDSENDVTEEPKPNIFMEYIRAKKAKVCPLVEYVD